MSRKLLTVDEFRSSAKDGARPDGMVLRLATSDAVNVDGKARTKRFCFSDGSVDRAGDTIDPNGWQLDNFAKNSVALWAHDSSSPPIGRANNVAVIGSKLMGDIEFAPPETYAFADTIYRLVDGGYIKAVSVGFMPIDYEFAKDKERPYGLDFTKQELFEISICPVPCNANALIEARSKGIDTRSLREWAENMLDLGTDTILMPRELLEETFRQAKTPKTIRQKYLNKPKAEEPVVVEPPKAMGEGDGSGSSMVPPGNCGRSKDETCGMVDPQECSVHAELIAQPEPKSKAGRKISAKNKALLEEAMGHHEAASTCIKAVMESDDGDGTEVEPDADDGLAEDHVVVVTLNADPDEERKKRIENARKLRASLNT